ncbi:50S ribosomal protein L25 [Bacteroidales bacterium AH-315-I05]|nr:50S ribosomal protein L25 [Bacteroidales bacterium AH-315-I05]
METITLNGSPRTLETKKEAQNLRREGNIPCVLYGGEGNQHFFADERQLAKLIFTPNVYIVKLNVDGKEYDTVIRDIQFHPVTDKVIHVDFFQLFEDRKVDIRIPVVLNGTSIGVKNGGRLRFNTKLLKIRAFPSALLDKIDINIEKT